MWAYEFNKTTVFTRSFYYSLFLWSIGQCLDHLIVADCLYFPAFKKLTGGNLKMRFWENWSPFGRLFGKVLVDQVKEKPLRRLNAPRILIPPRK